MDSFFNAVLRSAFPTLERGTRRARLGIEGRKRAYWENTSSQPRQSHRIDVPLVTSSSFCLGHRQRPRAYECDWDNGDDVSGRKSERHEWKWVWRGERGMGRGEDRRVSWGTGRGQAKATRAICRRLMVRRQRRPTASTALPCLPRARATRGSADTICPFPNACRSLHRTSQPSPRTEFIRASVCRLERLAFTQQRRWIHDSERHGLWLLRIWISFSHPSLRSAMPVSTLFAHPHCSVFPFILTFRLRSSRWLYLLLAPSPSNHDKSPFVFCLFRLHMRHDGPRTLRAGSKISLPSCSRCMPYRGGRDEPGVPDFSILSLLGLKQ
ncbi:hypothetical protein B0H12DRAFT_637367 [Mycena haematopus]|nr:hypothetical protein B0H12DRAFT_637367 [Mycena haematopus]